MKDALMQQAGSTPEQQQPAKKRGDLHAVRGERPATNRLLLGKEPLPPPLPYPSDRKSIAANAAGAPLSADVAEMRPIPRPPKGREEVPVQISRLLHAHEIVLPEARTMARIVAKQADDGTNDLLVSNVIRTNEMQVWFIAEHVVDAPIIHSDGAGTSMP